MKLKIGDKVKLFDCAEADLYPEIIFEVISDIWELGHGRKVVRITSKEKDINYLDITFNFFNNKLLQTSTIKSIISILK